MISIVIPLYNKEKFIAEAIQSVLDQTFQDFELLVINDGSTDNSEAIVTKFNDKRIRFISIENSGVSVARNTGIRKAINNWIAFLDADDWWSSDFLKEIVLAVNVYPTMKIFGMGRSRVFDSEIERYNNTFLPKEGTVGRVNYFQIISKDLPPINSSNVVINKDLLIEKGLFKEGMKQHEDHDLWLRICENEEIVFINKELSFYRKNLDDSASKSHFVAKDFERYLETIIWVSETLSEKYRPYFQTYYQRFVVIRYFQNSYTYSKPESRKIYRLSKKLKMKGKYKLMLWVIRTFSFVNLYGFFKKLKS